MHYTTTFRSRTIRRQGNSIFEFNFKNASGGVVNWFDATDSVDNGRQPACYYAARKWETGTYIEGGGFLQHHLMFWYLQKWMC